MFTFKKSLTGKENEDKYSPNICEQRDSMKQLLNVTLVAALLLAGCSVATKQNQSIGDGKIHSVERQGAVARESLPMRATVAATSSAAPSMIVNNYRNTEEYSHSVENRFRNVTDEPLSTFSIDVDGASFANVRRFLNRGQLPPVDAVRIEEFINYFSYDYPNPQGKHPINITTEAGSCPWNEKHRLVHIGLQGERIDVSDLPNANLVFLIDVSGSMNAMDKLPLLKKSLKMLSRELRAEDRVAIVVYAGAAGIVLPSTAGNKLGEISAALENLSAGGSTAGGAGIQLAYETAKKNFIKGGNNRVILATDGDFNVGASSEGALVRLIEDNMKDDIFLTVLGFGSGNYKDSKMEQLANKGNGNYSYIDNLLEAKKVLVSEMGGTLLTIAQDVKIQVEFNPTEVGAYRLIGYENRMLTNEDFNDDSKDAGELGAGHTVTALYEIIPAGSKKIAKKVDDLKYQKMEDNPTANHGELLTVKIRYKKPIGGSSILLSQALQSDTLRSGDVDWATSMAGFGMLLRDSKHKGDLSWKSLIELAKNSRGEDASGYRAEAIRMMEKAEILQIF